VLRPAASGIAPVGISVRCRPTKSSDRGSDLAFHHGPHFVRDGVHALDFEHVLVQPLEIGLHHDLAADDAGLIDAALLVIGLNGGI
jgi:hypothetical protein